MLLECSQFRVYLDGSVISSAWNQCFYILADGHIPLAVNSLIKPLYHSPLLFLGGKE